MAGQNDVEVWPDCWQAAMVFDAAGTQWLVGPAGAYGLNYQGVESTLRLQGIPRKQWPELFADIRALEAGALAQMRKK